MCKSIWALHYCNLAFTQCTYSYSSSFALIVPYSFAIPVGAVPSICDRTYTKPPRSNRPLFTISGSLFIFVHSKFLDCKKFC